MGHRSVRKSIDWPLVLLYVALVVMGWLNIYAAVYVEEHSSIFDVTQRYGQQLVWMVAGLGIALLVVLMDARFYYVFTYYIFGAVLVVLGLVLLFGVEIHNSRSWFALGSMRVQPSEFAKFATALAIAKCLSSHSFRVESVRSWLLAFFLLALPAGLILLQNDYGSSLTYGGFLLVFYRRGFSAGLLLFGLFLVLLFLLSLVISPSYVALGLGGLALLFYSFRRRGFWGAFRLGVVMLVLGGVLFLLREWYGLPLSDYVICLLPPLVGSLVGLVHGFWYRKRAAWLVSLMLLVCLGASYSVDYVFDNMLEVHHQRRINDMLGIEDDPLGWGYNVNQSKIAIGSGGLFGKGFLEGTQTKYNFVPEQSTDFIFCTVGEEWGFAGSVVVAGLFLVLLLRILAVAERQKTQFHRLYGYGVASILFVHFAVNISMTIGLFPVVGIPLPFFSYGGSSLWAFTVLLFILIKFDSVRLR